MKPITTKTIITHVSSSLQKSFTNLIPLSTNFIYNSKYILFETSYYDKPLTLESVIFKIESLGFIPILAHPERYRYLDEKEYFFLKDKGVLFQCNINSFGGFYGKTAKKKFEYLAKNKMIDFLGSDAHSMKYLHSLEMVLRNRKFHKIVKENPIKNYSL